MLRSIVAFIVLSSVKRWRLKREKWRQQLVPNWNWGMANVDGREGENNI